MATSNLAVGNADAHLKNFSLLADAGLRLSPAYDLLNTVVYCERYDQYAALEIGGKLRFLSEIDRPLLLHLGADIGLAPRASEAALQIVRKRLAAAQALRFEGRDPTSFRGRYREFVETGAARILS